jgi:hypothetical protein
MRHARSLPPRRRRLPRTAAFLGLVLTGWGRQQTPPYFYFDGSGPGCVPVVPAPPASVNSNVGDPSTQVIEGGTSSVEVPSRTTVVHGAQAPKKVVVSEPENRSRGSWHRNTEPDTAIATSVEGGTTTSDSTVVR